MKPKTMILMVVAVVCGLGASYMTSRLLAERDETPAEAPVVEKVTLLVAKKSLEMHTPLRLKPEDFFTEKQFTKEEAPKDALQPSDMPKLKNKFLSRGLRKGDHILPEDIIDGKGGLTRLPNGMRAIGMQVNQAMTAGGFATLPGSHVDIMWTSRKGNGNETFSKCLLEDVIVLAADTNDQAGNGGAIVASVVTVALNPDDSMKLTLAMETGTVKLALRNLEDSSTTTVEVITSAELMKPRNKKDEVAIAPPVVEPKVEPVIPAKDVTPPDPIPQLKVTKRTVTVRNGSDVTVHHYWVDEDDRIVAQPRDIDPLEIDPVPSPGSRAKKDDKGGPDL